MPKFLIIDANSIVNRAFYAIKELTNKDGLHTNGIYGFLNIILKEIETEKPDYIACAFDISRVTFRTALYSEYKGTRRSMPDELREQFPPLKELLSAMNIQIIEKENFEADDIIGTIAKACTNAQTECFILTGDKDDLQLVNDYTKVKLIISRMGKTETTVMDKEKIFEKYALLPEELIELKALMGDKSDNIPGVAGIGEVTGLGLIQKYKTLENVYKNTALIGDSIKKKLVADKENAFLSRTLGTIDCNVDIDTNIEKYKVQAPNNQEFLKMLTNLNFTSFIKKYSLGENAAPSNANETIENQSMPEIEILTFEEFKKISSQIKEFYYLISDENIFINFEQKVYSFNLLKNIDIINSILENEKILKISYRLKQQLHNNLKIAPEIADIELMTYVCDPKNNDSKIEELFLQYKSINASTVATQIFNLPDLYKYLNKLITENELVYINEIEHYLIFILFEMEKQGIKIDSAGLDALSVQFTKEIEEISNKIYALAGEEFNISSPKQLGEILFVKLGLPTDKKTKSGFSTNSEVLEKLTGTHSIIDLVKEYRQLTKLNSTYVEGLKTAKDDHNIVHTTFKQTLTQTGRLSSTEPNLQNIPIRYPLGRKIREVIVPKNDIFISADYTQIELRVLAHIANDENLINAFLMNEDIHNITAKKIFNIEEVTSTMRRASKAVNFGLIYGKGAFSLAKDLGISRADAQSYIDKYLGQYPNVQTYMNNVVLEAKNDGYTKTLYNRRRYFPDLKSSNHMVRTAAERAVLNTPIQGTAADIIKLAMLNVGKQLKLNNLKSSLVLQIHDELIIDCIESEKEEVSKLLQSCMENAVKLSVPLTVSLSIGKNLDQCK
jgi:DNA polymerase-1